MQLFRGSLAGRPEPQLGGATRATSKLPFVTVNGVVVNPSNSTHSPEPLKVPLRRLLVISAMTTLPVVRPQPMSIASPSGLKFLKNTIPVHTSPSMLQAASSGSAPVVARSSEIATKSTSPDAAGTDATTTVCPWASSTTPTVQLDVVGADPSSGIEGPDAVNVPPPAPVKVNVIVPRLVGPDVSEQDTTATMAASNRSPFTIHPQAVCGGRRPTAAAVVGAGLSATCRTAVRT